MKNLQSRPKKWEAKFSRGGVIIETELMMAVDNKSGFSGRKKRYVCAVVSKHPYRMNNALCICVRKYMGYYLISGFWHRKKTQTRRTRLMGRPIRRLIIVDNWRTKLLMSVTDPWDLLGTIEKTVSMAAAWMTSGVCRFQLEKRVSRLRNKRMVDGNYKKKKTYR